MDSSSIDTGSRFLASTLHEIRTPIQTIISTVELLNDTNLDKEQTEYVRQIEFGANVLLQLANDVLDFTKIRSNEFKLENIPYDPSSLTEHVVDLISIDAFNKGIEVVTDIDYSIPKNVMGDPTRVQQIILNLVKNAVKFTPQGHIVVHVTKTQKDLMFEVIDSGIGIPEEKQSLIFKDFYQVDASTTRKYGGTGLGLSICKNLVSVMKGKIGVRTNPEGGSIFWFSIPMEASPESPFDREKNELEPPSDTNILIVDDSPQAAKALAHKIMSLGILAIDTASSAEEAMAKLKYASQSGKPFTIVFADMIMPGIDGWHLAANITGDKSIKKPTMLLVVPEGQMGKDAKMKMLNWYNGYIYKPVKRASLYSILDESFNQLLDLENSIPGNNTLLPEKKLPPENEKETPLSSIESEKPAAGRKVLVAEDHPVNRKLIETFLKKFGAEVFLAENGLEAVQETEKHPDIDIIFMDIQMPVKNGIDATVEIRAKNFQGIIIACTANNDKDDFAAYMEMGINDILVKPFKSESIRQLLEKWTAVLSLSGGKNAVTLTDVNNRSAEFWDLALFLETIGGNTRAGITIVNDFIKLTAETISAIKNELSKDSKNLELLEKYAATLSSSSENICAEKLSEYGKTMEEAAKKGDLTQYEAARMDFAIDFLEVKKIFSDWKKTVA